MLRQRHPRAGGAAERGDTDSDSDDARDAAAVPGQTRRHDELHKIAKAPLRGVLRIVSGLVALYAIISCVRGLHIFSPWSEAADLDRVATIASTGGIFLMGASRNLARWLTRSVFNSHADSAPFLRYTLKTAFNLITVPLLFLIVSRSHDQWFSSTFLQHSSGRVRESVLPAVGAGFCAAVAAVMALRLGRAMGLDEAGPGSKTSVKDTDAILPKNTKHWDPIRRLQSPQSAAIAIVARFANMCLVAPVVDELFWRAFLLTEVCEGGTAPVDIASARGASVWCAAAVSVLFAAGERQTALAPVASFLWGMSMHFLLSSHGIEAAIIGHAVRSFVLCVWVLVSGDFVLWKVGG